MRERAEKLLDKDRRNGLRRSSWMRGTIISMGCWKPTRIRLSCPFLRTNRAALFPMPICGTLKREMGRKK